MRRRTDFKEGDRMNVKVVKKGTKSSSPAATACVPVMM
jgi:hypothetical protein